MGIGGEGIEGRDVGWYVVRGLERVVVVAYGGIEDVGVGEVKDRF